MATKVITLKIRNLDELQKRVVLFPALSAPIVSETINKIIETIENTARPLTPRRSGRLIGGYKKARKLSTPRTLRGQVGSVGIAKGGITDYAPFVHFGTGLFGPRHRLIVPKKAKVLHWVQNGQDVFARSSKGQRPNPYFQKALDKSRFAVDREVIKGLQKITRTLALR